MKGSGIRRRQDEDRSTKELGERRLNEAFTPGGTNGQLFIEGLPTYPDSGDEDVAGVI